jgi:hypothetical protein
MAEQLLNISQIRSMLQEVRCKAVPECMNTAKFWHTGFYTSIVEYFRNSSAVEQFVAIVSHNACQWSGENLLADGEGSRLVCGIPKNQYAPFVKARKKWIGIARIDQDSQDFQDEQDKKGGYAMRRIQNNERPRRNCSRDSPPTAL